MRDRMIVTGGTYATSPSGSLDTRSDTWALSLADLTWSRLPAEPAVALERAYAPLVYDPGRDAMVLFGGAYAAYYSLEEPRFDAWSLPLATAAAVWTPLAPAPPVLDTGRPALFPGLVDLPHDRLVALSLSDHAAYAHPLDGSGSWTALAIDGEAPPPRINTALVLDAPAHRALLFGGEDGVARGDLWSLRLDEALTVRVSAATADAKRDGVALAWSTSHAQRTFGVERSPHAAGAWAPLGQVSSDATGRVAFEDRAITASAAYDYRLSYSEGSARWTGGVVSAVVPPAPALALAGARPNPAVRGLVVEFTLPEDGSATLELLDVSGRRLLVRDLGVLGLGTHSIDLAAGGRFPAGLYLVRLRTAAGERVKRVALLD